MGLREAQGSPGPPWERPLRGRLHKLVVESEALAGNPLGDPARRPLVVYVPPGLDEGQRVPSIYVLQGLTGQLDMWFNREAFEATMMERVDALFGTGECAPAIVVFIDAWTSYGGAQFINSTSTGRYLDYLCDEVVPFIDERFPTFAERDRRGVSGKSSGGYGAMVVPMLRPDVFGALASHAGDALFEVCYLPEFRETVRILRDQFAGSFEAFWDAFRHQEHLDFERFGSPMNVYCMAACYSPDESNPGKVLLPFEVETGRLLPEIWERWLQWDPVRMVERHVEDLSSLRRIYIDAGNKDQFYLDLGAQAFASQLDRHGIDYSLDLFEGTHSGIQYRYPGALGELATALSA